MKKYISYLFSILVAVAALTSCSEDAGTEPGSDGAPKAVIYTYTPGEPYNPDNDIQLRIATNQQTSEAYYLAELATEKEKHIASMGENGYMDYVISNGTKIEGVSGNSNVDIFLTDLVGNYSITVVAINGNTRTSSSVNFMGIEWSLIGEGYYTAPMFGVTDMPVQVYKAGHAEWYKMPSIFEEGKDMVIKVNGASATVDQQDVFTEPTYGSVYVAGSGVVENGVITLTLQYTCSAGSFGTFNDVLKLPTQQ